MVVITPGCAANVYACAGMVLQVRVVLYGSMGQEYYIAHVHCNLGMWDEVRSLSCNVAMHACLQNMPFLVIDADTRC